MNGAFEEIFLSTSVVNLNAVKKLGSSIYRRVLSENKLKHNIMSIGLFTYFPVTSSNL